MPTTEEYFIRFQPIYDLYWKNYNKYLLKYPITSGKELDLRLAIFGLPGNILTAYNLAMKMTETCLSDQNWWETHTKERDIEKVKEIVSHYDISIRHGYFVLFLARIEWILRNMLVLVKPGACDNGLGEFKNVYSSLFSEINTPHLEAIFDLARILRNTIHNNGYYCSKSQRDSSPITYRGKTHIFKHGKTASGATSLSFDLYEDLILACVEIVDSPRIEAFPNMYPSIPT